MERRTLDLKTISGKGIKSFGLFVKPSLYATVSVDGGGPDRKQKKERTPADRAGGENPEWDQPIQIVLESPDPSLVLQFDIMDQGFLGDRHVGSVRVPVADLSSEDLAGAFRPASYLVQTSGGKPNGVLTFLYKMNGGEGRIPPPDPAVYYPPPASAAGYSPPKMEYYPPPAPTSGYYPPPPPPTSGYYPPPPAPTSGDYPQLPAAPDPAVHYPPLPAPALVGYPAAPDPAVHHPPLPADYPQAPAPAICYPPPAADSGYFPRLYPAIGYPAPPVGGYYPPASPVHVACYPPQEPYSYLMEGHHRETYRCC